MNVPVRTELGREIRGCFEAEDGNVLVSADYSQVELRILAHVADEPVLKEIFTRGEDVHTATASQVFDKQAADLTPMDRSKAKMINYGIVYGLSDYGLADRLNIPREEAKAFIDAYLERFPRVHAFMTGDDRAGQGGGLRDDAVRPPPPDPRAEGAQLPGAHAGRAAGRQHGHPGHGGRRDEARHGARAPRAGRRGPGDAADPHHPRRAALRGPAGGGRRGARPGRARDGRCRGATASRRWRSTSASGRTWMEAK